MQMSKFILGMVFALVAIPILDGLTSVALTFLESLKSKLGIIIAKNNKIIEGKPNKKPIGFSIAEEEEDDI